MSSHTSRPCFSQGNKAGHLSEQKGLVVTFRDGAPGAWPRLIAGLLLSPHPALPGSQARQCYSFQHIYFGPFDLTNVNFSNVSCQGCSEAVLSLNTGEGQEALKNKKGAGTGHGDGGATSARWGWERGDR